MGTESIGTIDMAGKALQGAGLFASTLGAYKKSKGERTGYQYQSQIAKKNEGIAELQASDALLRGQSTENTVRHKTVQLKATQIATMAARNLDLSTGNALEILTSTDFMGERDALTARDNANREAWGFKVQAANYSDNARLLDWRASQQNPLMDAAGTLLTGAGTVASSWYAMRNRQVGSPRDE